MYRQVPYAWFGAAHRFRGEGFGVFEPANCLREDEPAELIHVGRVLLALMFMLAAVGCQTSSPTVREKAATVQSIDDEFRFAFAEDVEANAGRWGAPADASPRSDLCLLALGAFARCQARRFRLPSLWAA